MKLFRSLVFLFAVTGFVGAACAQDNPSKFAGEINANNFAYGWKNTPGLQVDLANGPSPTGSTTLTVAYGNVTLSDGTVIAPLSITAPVTVGIGANQETVTPTAVSCSTPQVYQSCSFTASFTYQHGTGDRVISGTYGLQDALNYAQAFGLSSTGPGGIVTIDARWYQLGGTQATVIAAIPYSNVYILDNSGFPGLRYFTPTATNQTTSSFTTAPTLTTTGTGTLTSGTYYVKTACIDLQGQVSQSSSESTQTGTVTNIVITAPTCSAASGEVGYIAYITAASGGSGSETYYPLLAKNCTLTALENVIPSCAIANTTYGQSASNATLTTNPATTTAKVIGATDTVNRTAFAYYPASSIAAVGPIPVTILGQAATSTTAATYNVGSLTFQGGLFSQVGREYNICVSGHFTYATTGTNFTMSLYEGQYNNSDVALATTTVATSTATSGNAVFKGCFNIDIIASTTTASALAHAALAVPPVSIAAGSTIWTDTNVAAITSLPNSGVQWLRLTATASATLGTGGIVVDSISILPIH